MCYFRAQQELSERLASPDLAVPLVLWVPQVHQVAKELT